MDGEKTSDLKTTKKLLQEPYSERFKDRKPRIFVGVVAYGDVDAQILESWVHWAMYAGKNYSERFEISFGIAHKMEQYRARNKLIKEAIEHDADFLLMIDDDHTVHDCIDMIDKFYDLEKPVQGGLYIQRRDDRLVPVVMKYDQNDTIRFLEMDELPTEPGPVDVTGGGINWIDMKIMYFLTEPWWWPNPYKPENVVFLPKIRFGLDINFCMKVKRELDIDTWLNTNVRVGHLVAERRIVRVINGIDADEARV